MVDTRNTILDEDYHSLSILYHKTKEPRVPLYLNCQPKKKLPLKTSLQAYYTRSL